MKFFDQLAGYLSCRVAALFAGFAMLSMSLGAELNSEEGKGLPTFAGPTPNVPRSITIPTVDLSAEKARHSIVARGTPDTYHGHCDTVLLPDGKTMFTAWTVDHAQRIGPLARSEDGGRTWSSQLEVPSNWHETANTPSIHRLVDPEGKARLLVFGDGLDWRRKGKPPYPMHQAISEDEGKSWTPMKPNGVEGEVPPKTILGFDEGRRLVLWSDLPGFVVQSESIDGGRSWTRERRILKVPDRWGQPCVIRSPDGKQLLMLLRENSRKYQSLYSISKDDAETWSEPRELPASLTGDRHVARFAPDGRLVVAMRDMATTSSSYGHYVAWVGRWDNILNGHEGEYRIKLLHNANRTEKDVPGKGNTDCGYSDLEVLPDGTLVATTYIKYQAGPEKNSVVSTRFQLGETDALLKQQLRGPQEWTPLDGQSAKLSDLGGEQIIPEIVITETPKPTADVSRFKNEYVIELKKFGISDAGINPVETSRGLNEALQHAKSLGANRILFPKGTYLISETDPIVLDHTDTIIDLNGATLQVNPNGLQKYSMVDILPGAENLRLTNGMLRGDKDEHDYTTEKGVHAWGHGLTVHGGRNLELDHLTISNVTGDGANSRFTGARNRAELLANIAHSVYVKELEQGAFSREGEKIGSKKKTRSIAPYDLTKCKGEFEFGYSTGYLGYPFVQGRLYQAYFYDDAMKFIERKECLQFRKVSIPDAARFLHLEFNQPEVSDIPLHAGAGKGSFIGRISNFKGSADVHFHHNKLIGNRRLGMGYCGGRRWLIEANEFTGNGGVAPAYGIDLEDGWEFMQDVVIRNNRFKDNVAGDLVICAGSELLVEGNIFEKNVALHGRPHNYIFRNNQFRGGHVGYKTRTGVARIYNNQYENCTISIKYDTAAVADGLNREPGQVVVTRPLRLENESLTNVEKITGTYFDFENATIQNAKFIAGQETSQIRFRNCTINDSSIAYESKGPRVKVQWEGNDSIHQTGPGLNRRDSVDLGMPFFHFNEAQRSGTFFDLFAKWAREDIGRKVSPEEILVIGSSSIKGWRNMAADLGPAKIIQRGFGGSRMKDVLLYKDFFRRYGAERILIYEGDNDLGGSYDLDPAEFFAHCQEFVEYVSKDSPATRFYFLSIKPSTARMKKWPIMKQGNDLLQQYAASDERIEYLDIASPMLQSEGIVREELIGKDGVHMTRSGYDIWAKVIRSRLVDP